jgi:TPR repeat protein
MKTEEDQSDQQPLVSWQVGVGLRLFWGIIVGAVLLLCWRLFAGGWPNLNQHWWFWLIVGIATLIVIWLCPLLTITLRYLRLIMYRRSKEFRLENPNIWTDIEHIEKGGAIEMMRMEDGQFILLSIGTATAKVFVRSKLDHTVSPIELASLPIPEFLNRMDISREKRRDEDESILNQLRKVIGWPKSIDELKQKLETLGANPFGLLSTRAAAPKGVAVPGKFQKFKSNAEQEDAEAQCALAYCHYFGEGVAKNVVEAVIWFRKAAEQNHADAQFNLGAAYSLGVGAEKDFVEAAKWYHKAAEQNHPYAQFALGDCYAKGEGLTKNASEAVKWWRKAAEQGQPDAQFNLGNAYAKGDGVPKDFTEAVKWWLKAAEQNDVQAQYNLGNAYTKGDGVAEDYIEAAKWWRKAAEQNHADAQYCLGGCYCIGQGVSESAEEAVKWWLKAAEQNHADAQYELGIRYDNGEGVAKDEVEAVKLWLKAAEQNHTSAQFNLAMRFYSAAKDYVEAYAWFSMAAKADSDAVNYRDLLEKELTPEQFTAAQKRVDELRSQIEAKSKLPVGK